MQQGLSGNGKAFAEIRGGACVQWAEASGLLDPVSNLLRRVVTLLLFSLAVGLAQASEAWALSLNASNVNPTVTAGTEASYNVTVTNTEFTASTSTVLTMTIPAGTTFTGSTGTITGCTPVPGPGGSTVTCTVPALGAAGSPTASASFTPRLLTTVPGTITLVIEIPGQRREVRTTVVSPDRADLVVSLTPKASVTAGEVFTHTVSVQNNGPDPSGSTLLTFDLSPVTDAVILEAPAGCTQVVGQPGRYTCFIPGPLAVGGPPQNFAFKVQAVKPNASFSATADLSASTVVDPNGTNDSATSTTSVQPGTDLAITKSRSPSGVLIIDMDVTFTLSTSFTGSSPLGATVTDTLPAQYGIVLPVQAPAGWSCSVSGQTVTCTRTSGPPAGRNVPLGDIIIRAKVVGASGGSNIVNQATIARSGLGLPDNNPSNNTADDGGVLIQDRIVDLEALKSGPRNMVPGGTGIFEISTKNNDSVSNGTVAFHGLIRMTDTLPPGFTFVGFDGNETNGWNCGTPPASGPIVCTRSDYTPTSPLAPGSLTPSVRMIVRAPDTVPPGLPPQNSMTVTFDSILFTENVTGNNTARLTIGLDPPEIAANLRVVKTALTSPIAAGAIQTFRIEVINAGPVTATNVRLSDVLSPLLNTNTTGPNPGYIGPTITANAASGITCSSIVPTTPAFARVMNCDIATLPVCVAGSNCPVFDVRVRPAGPSGTLTNTAYAVSSAVADPDVTDNSGTATYIINGQADVSVTKTGSPANPRNGDRITYSIRVTNNSTTRSPAVGVDVTDTLPLGVTFRSATPGSGSCNTTPAPGAVVTESNRVMKCQLGTISPGGGAARTMTVIVDTTNSTAGQTLNNVIRIDDRPAADGDNPANNQASFALTMPPLDYDLLLEKFDSVDPVKTGDTTTYSVRVTNTGIQPVTNVRITDTLPASHLALASEPTTSGGTCTTSGLTVTCTYPQLLRNETRTVSLVMRGTSAGRATNVAEVTSTETIAGLEPDTGNNRDEETTDVIARADIGVTKTVSKSPVELLEPFAFTVTVSNASGFGFVDAENVTLADTMDPGMELTGTPTAVATSGSASALTCGGAAGQRSFSCNFGTLSSGGVIAVTVPVRITSVSALPQSFLNTASVDTTSADDNPANDTAQASASVTATASLAGMVYRDFNNNGVQDSGETGIANVQMELASSSGGAPVTVNTASDGTYSFPLLAPGTYSVRRGPVSEAGFENGRAIPGSAGGSASGATLIQSISLSSAAATGYDFTIIPQTPSISITKALASGPDEDADGTFTASFTLEIRNDSLEDLSGIEVTDVLAGAAPSFGSHVGSISGPGQYTIISAPSGTCSGLRADYDGDGQALAASGFSLAPGASCTIGFGLRAMPVDPLPAEYQNQASAAGQGTLSGLPSTDDSDVVRLSPAFSAAITLVKTGVLDDGGDGLTIGDEVAYSFRVTNTGSVNLSAVALTDTKVSGISCPTADLLPGAFMDCTADPYVITEADFLAGSIDNTATVTGRPPSGVEVTASDSFTAVLPQVPRLTIDKVMSRHTDTDGNGFVSPGDTLAYTSTATNTGNTTLTDVVVSDDKISPASITCASVAPAGTCVLEGSLTVTIQDAQAGKIVNTATAASRETSPVTDTVEIPVKAAGDVNELTKTALDSSVKRGERVPFVIRADNVALDPARIVDIMPPGFSYVEGSARANGVALEPAIDGRRLTFDGLTPDEDADIRIELTLLATAAAPTGVSVNRAELVNPATGEVLDTARARVTILEEAVFDCSDVIGKVFDDRNRNGYQDEGEPGLPGVRLATVKGLLVTTDPNGRFSIACADIPDEDIGSNFIVKLDTRTLPTGYRVTSENPRKVRLTRGKVVKLNFGAAITRLVALDLNDKVFGEGSETLSPKWQAGLDRLITALAAEPSSLRITYVGEGGKLAKARLRAVSREIQKRWAAQGGGYKLTIESRIVAEGGQ